MNESDLQMWLADYLRVQYPDVLFHSDFGSGVKLTPGQAVRQKRQNGGRRAWPDMFIAQPRIIKGKTYHGLFIELKKEGTRLQKKNGEWATDHISEQAKMLDELKQRGYGATFAVGFDEVKSVIDEYLKEEHGD